MPAETSPQRILVTGGAGFIGSALCRYLIAEGYDVLNVDKLTYAANLKSLEPIASDPRYRFLNADIADAEAMREAIARFRPDAVMHLAAESHVDRSITGSAAFIETNILGTYRLLEAARDYWSSLPAEEAERFRFLQVSTDEVYGSLGAEGLFTETTPYNPSSPYSASKAAADHLGVAWHRTYGMPVIVSNCSNNYGPYHFPEKLIPLALTNALEGRPIPVYGDGSNVRDWLFVEDHVRALLLAVTRGEPGRKYNIGGRAESSNLNLVRLLCTILDEFAPEGGPHQRLIEFVTDRPGHDRRYAIDPSEAETHLGWSPAESLETGLRKTVRWYMDHRDWWEPIRGIYRGERLGLIAPAAGGAAGG